MRSPGIFFGKATLKKEQLDWIKKERSFLKSKTKFSLTIIRKELSC